MELPEVILAVADTLREHEDQLDWGVHVMGRKTHDWLRDPQHDRNPPQQVGYSLSGISQEKVHVCGHECRFSSRHGAKHPFCVIIVGGTVRRVSIFTSGNPSFDPDRGQPSYTLGLEARPPNTPSEGSEGRSSDWSRQENAFIERGAEIADIQSTVEDWVVELLRDVGTATAEEDSEYEFLDTANELSRITPLTLPEAKVQALVELGKPDSEIQSKLNISEDELADYHTSIADTYAKSQRFIEQTTPRNPGERLPLSADARRLAVSIDDMNQMEPREFEAYIGEIWEQDGYEVSQTSPGADGGVDLIATADGETIVIQVKQRSRGTIGEPTVRDLLGALHSSKYNHADRAAIVTTGSFSQPARQFAKENPELRLVSGSDIVELFS